MVGPRENGGRVVPFELHVHNDRWRLQVVAGWREDGERPQRLGRASYHYPAAGRRRVEVRDSEDVFMLQRHSSAVSHPVFL
jgi:hypothetical protein